MSFDRNFNSRSGSVFYFNMKYLQPFITYTYSHFKSENQLDNIQHVQRTEIERSQAQGNSTVIATAISTQTLREQMHPGVTKPTHRSR